MKKLSKETVLAIRERYCNGEGALRLRREFKLDRSEIMDIIHHNKYREFGGPKPGQKAIEITETNGVETPELPEETETESYATVPKSEIKDIAKSIGVNSYALWAEFGESDMASRNKTPRAHDVKKLREGYGKGESIETLAQSRNFSTTTVAMIVTNLTWNGG